VADLSEDDLIHEATHLLLDETVNVRRARVPAWLNEGLAMYFESGARRQDTAEQAARRGDLLDLRAMNTRPGRPDAVRVFYAQSWSVVKYLIDTHGEHRITELLGTINSGVPPSEALSFVYGVSVDEIDAQWRSQFSRRTTLANRPDPGTIATSTLISGAVAVAAAVTFWRWIAYRRRPAPTESEYGDEDGTSAET
jgi:hypothetical protein